MTAKSKAELMAKSRERKQLLGQVRREYWATPDQHKEIKKLLKAY